VREAAAAAVMMRATLGFLFLFRLSQGWVRP